MCILVSPMAYFPREWKRLLRAVVCIGRIILLMALLASCFSGSLYYISSDNGIIKVLINSTTGCLFLSSFLFTKTGYILIDPRVYNNEFNCKYMYLHISIVMHNYKLITFYFLFFVLQVSSRHLYHMLIEFSKSYVGKNKIKIFQFFVYIYHFETQL